MTVVGLAGATITSLVLTPTPRRSDVSVALLGTNEDLATITGLPVVLGSPLNLTPNTIWNTPNAFDGPPAFTHDGRVVLAKLDTYTSKYQLYLCNLDGSNITQMTKSALQHHHPAVSPNNKLVAFDDNAGHIYYMPLAINGTETKSAINIGSSYANYPTFSPDNDTVAYCLAPNVGGFQAQVYFASLTKTATPVLASNSTFTSYVHPNWSPDGTKIAYGATSNSASVIVTADATQNSQYETLPAVTGFVADYPAFTPDSLALVYQQTPVTAGAQASSIMISDVDGFNTSMLTTLSSKAKPIGLACSGFLPPTTTIGASGALGTSASGFLWSQSSDSFAAMVGFGATTPSKATATQVGGTNSLVYDLHADAVTSLKYTNSYYAAPTFSVTPPAGTTDVFVSFSSTTGQITMVAPFARRDKNSPKPTATQLGDVTVFKGPFTGIWNANGQNVAPNGASQISLETAKGTVIRIQP